MTTFSLGRGGFYNEPDWSPDDEHILFHDKTNRIAYLTIETGQITEVARIEGSLGEVHPGAVWSPDSKWIAFENRNPRTMYDHIALYELESGKITSVTDGFGFASSPAFSPDNKHLFFQATVEVGPNLFGLDMSSSASRPSEGSLYVAVLQKDGEKLDLYDMNVSTFELGPQLKVGRFALSPDGKRGYAGLSDMVVIDMETQRVILKKEKFERGRTNNSMIVGHDGTKLYVSGVGDTVSVYDTATLELIKTVYAGGDFMMPPIEIPNAATSQN